MNIEDDASEQQILLDQNAWNSPEAGIAAVLLQKKGSLKSLKIKAKSLSKKSATTKKGRTTKKTTKSKKKQGKKQATKKKVPKTAVQKALQAAANAKIEAMAQQRKALQAASKAKEAAAKAANAPMNKRGHEIVKRAQILPETQHSQWMLQRLRCVPWLKPRQKHPKRFLMQPEESIPRILDSKGRVDTSELR